MQQPSSFYDLLYIEGGTGKEYLKEPKDCVYYPAWLQVMAFLDPDTDRILELGCGPGQLAQLLLAHRYSYALGIDFSPEAIRLAIKRNEGQPEKFYVWN